MKSTHKTLLTLITSLAAGAGAAYGSQPPDVVGSDAQDNTAMGASALEDLAGGVSNTAAGAYSLLNDSTGDYNTAIGALALENNLTGGENTATGADSLLENSSGSNNAAFGVSALLNNTIGNDNTSIGVSTLISNTNGDYNTAAGFSALYSNIGGNYNTASGYFALHNNTSGSQNSAHGVQALYGNKTGNFNTASGTDALYSNTTGSTSIALGYKAGYNLTTGSNNIDIGNLGAAAESGTIRIGTTSTHIATYIAGIYGTSVTGNAVVVSSTGQLGVTVSSERYKTGITRMGSTSLKLQQLRPVTFRLKTDPKGALQYGLIAEEVAKVYPDLVIRDGTGRIDGVRYDELAPILLNEVQQQQRRLAAQDELNALQARQIRDLKQQQLTAHTEQARMQQQMASLTMLNEATQVALRRFQAANELVAQR
jgi:hypothetical protein